MAKLSKIGEYDNPATGKRGNLFDFSDTLQLLLGAFVLVGVFAFALYAWGAIKVKVGLSGLHIPGFAPPAAPSTRPAWTLRE